VLDGPTRDEEQEHGRRCCRNAVWTRENHKVREVIKATCEKLDFTPGLGTVRDDSFFSP